MCGFKAQLSDLVAGPQQKPQKPEAHSDTQTPGILKPADIL